MNMECPLHGVILVIELKASFSTMTGNLFEQCYAPINIPITVAGPKESTRIVTVANAILFQ
jgi:hypothetical protein